MKNKGILERLKDGPVLGDGGYLLEPEKRGWVRAGPFTPEVALLIRRLCASCIYRVPRGRSRGFAGANFLCQPRQAGYRWSGKSPGRFEPGGGSHSTRSRW